jgi:glycosyltransferase involved in cell wall biosynthesis
MYDIVYVGRIVVRQKRIDKLHELIKRLDMKPISYRFHVFGDGDKYWKDKLGHMPNVIMHGHVGNWWEKVPKDSVFVSVSDYEGCPLSLIEFSKYCSNRFMVIKHNGLRQYVSDNCAFDDLDQIVSNLANGEVPHSRKFLELYYDNSISSVQVAKIIEILDGD